MRRLGRERELELERERERELERELEREVVYCHNLSDSLTACGNTSL